MITTKDRGETKIYTIPYDEDEKKKEEQLRYNFTSTT